MKSLDHLFAKLAKQQTPEYLWIGCARGQQADVHGWIYSIRDGLLKDLGVTVSGESRINEQ